MKSSVFGFFLRLFFWVSDLKGGERGRGERRGEERKGKKERERKKGKKKETENPNLKGSYNQFQENNYESKQPINSNLQLYKKKYFESKRKIFSFFFLSFP